MAKPVFKGTLLLVRDQELLGTARTLSWESAVQCVSRTQMQVSTYHGRQPIHFILATYVLRVKLIVCVCVCVQLGYSFHSFLQNVFFFVSFFVFCGRSFLSLKCLQVPILSFFTSCKPYCEQELGDLRFHPFPSFLQLYALSDHP